MFEHNQIFPTIVSQPCLTRTAQSSCFITVDKIRFSKKCRAAVFSGSSSLLLAFCQIGFGFKKGPDAVLDLGTGFGTNFGRPIAFLLRKGAENRCQNWDPQLEI